MYIVGPKLFSHHFQAHYSPQYLSRIQTWIQAENLSPIGAVMKAKEDYFSEFSKITYAYSGGYYLQYFEGEKTLISISDHEIPINPKNERNNLVNRNSGLFYQFVEAEKEQGSFISISKSQEKFLIKHKINFLVLSKHVTINEELNLLVKEKIVDSLSGEQFLLLH